MDTIYSGLYIENELLLDYSVSCARLLSVSGECSGGRAAAVLRQCYNDVRLCHNSIERRYGDMASPPPACEWLLDNWYMVRREYISALSEIKRAAQLRCSSEGLLIWEIGRTLIECSHGVVTEERCKIFLDGFQSVTPLRRGELVLFCAALRGAIIENIAKVCHKMQYASNTESHAKALSALFSSLRLFAVLDTEKLIESVDISNAILSADPTGDYPRMDNMTRHEYLRRLGRMARKQKLEEHELAKRLIKKASGDMRHVGFYMFKAPSLIWARLYIFANFFLTAALTILLSLFSHSPIAALLLLLPISELIKRLLDYVLLHAVSPHPLPRMDMQNGVSSEGRSICVISSILGGDEASRLEELRLASRSEGVNLLFGLLADLPEARQERTDSDAELLLQAKSEVERLNRKYGGGFYLFTRKRSFNGETYSGRERKRGAILELAKLLCDEDSQLSVTGDKDALENLRFIISLDSDTRIYPGSIGELIGAALHPLCAPVIDSKTKVVISGHAIIHPRIETDLNSANATDFALVFAGAGGSDPYGSLCGELYMDAFGSGGFTGKGLIDAKALLECTHTRFPDGRILSHDALEGACLRGGYMGDAAFSDRFPAAPLAYFKRLHRWVRGDWQNAGWVFKKDFSSIDRFRLFDSLRRSLLPPATFLAITAGFFINDGGLRIAAWAALISLLSNLLISLAEKAAERRRYSRLRRHTRLMSGVGGAIVQTFMRLWLLPYEAFVCLHALSTALWRMLISKKRLLQWQTSSQSERGSEGLAEQVKAMWFPVALGVLLMAFSPEIIGKASGFMWLLSPAAAAALALPARREVQLCAEDREFLLKAAAESWRYLSDFSRSEDNYLPPDNFQEQPPVGLAHRSSPTNIGLALAAAVAVSDMGIISREDAAVYIGRAVSTLEKMPRLYGHFFNWYDTRTLQTLKPAYISTVDSGNLYAGFITAKAALTSWGERELAARIAALMATMDFSRLFDRDRGLFYICYDAANDRGAGGWYDLLASESMLTSYIAIAKGDVPKKHWRTLSRAQLQKDGYRGLASWTGTMFEYLMPALFLPVYRGSLLYESDRFCVYAQKKSSYAGKPWGISESAFYSLDPSLSYRYKAHGCPALALKRGQEADLVISPYSSFLSLCIDLKGSVTNLRRLSAFGALGRYGFMEALDFTPGRCRNENGERVRCYMAHHVSMSIIGAANAICDNSMCKRFMSDSSMKAYSLLLQEKLPDSGVIIRGNISEVPEKPRRDISRQWRLLGDGEDDVMHCAVLSNGAYNILLSSTGHSLASLGDINIYKGSPDFGGLEILCNGKSIMPTSDAVLWEFSEERARFCCQAENIECSVLTSTAGGDCGEIRTVEMRSAQKQTVSLSLRFRPILAQLRDYNSHPAYWQLGMTAELEDGALLLRRLPRGGSRGLWLCVMCSEKAVMSAEQGGGLGALAEPFVELCLELSLESERAKRVHFALCVSPEKSEARAGAERMVLGGGAAPGNMVGAAALHLGMSHEEIAAAMDMVAPLWLSPLYRAAPRRELWQYGISGDLPLICCDGRAVESTKLLRRFCLLKSCGVNSELCLFSDEAGEYLQPLLQRVSQTLSVVGLESLIGSPGGVYLVPFSGLELVQSRASVIIGDKAKALSPLPHTALSRRRSPGSVPRHQWSSEYFEFFVDESLPSRIWQHILTNSRFGYIAADCGAGSMWFENAREMRVNPLPESIRAVEGSESLYLSLSDGSVSLFAANDNHSCSVKFGSGFASWEKELGSRSIKTTAFIPAGIDARVFLIEGAEGLRLSWSLSLIFGSEDGSSVIIDESQNLISIRNPEAYFPEATLLLGASIPFKSRSDFIPAGVEMQLICDRETVLVCGCCSKRELVELCTDGVAAKLLSVTAERWSRLTGLLRLRSACPPLDNYISPWAAYQSISCRLDARTSLYQSGGAFGFRDQLQDSVNLMLLSPSYAKEQIISCCRHQYVEGDVMHWWHRHPDGDRGVRTRCSDDMLWLTWALCEYCEATGDMEFCFRELPYISSPRLSAEEQDRYERPEQTDAHASVLDHAKAALNCCINRGFGPHGLPFFGSGDWNDAFSEVGGESVWLGWFLALCSDNLSSLLERLGLGGAERYRRYAEDLGSAADDCFNGQWYSRGYYADGEPLGSPDRLDSLAQSWAVLSRRSSLARAEVGLGAALERLVDREHKLVKLFDPPFSAFERSPGYITSYGEGFRENGGQYTHGAIWLAMAAFKLGRSDEGWEILRLLLPEGRDLSRYEAEPFVLAADVYSAKGHEGKAGWTWYTGSAGWYFRAVTEYMLGLKLKDGKLRIEPSLPSSLPDCEIAWTDMRGKKHLIKLGENTVTMDGKPYSGKEGE